VLGVIYAILFYIATAIIVVGVAMRIRSYARTPAPLKIPTTPAPTTGSGVFWRMLREVVFFQSLYKSNKWIWLFGWMMHMSLWLILARHVRYFTYDIWWWVEAVQFAGTYAAFTFLIGLGGLLLRRNTCTSCSPMAPPSKPVRLQVCQSRLAAYKSLSPYK
jgi:nitrate reductase gamma subunit